MGDLGNLQANEEGIANFRFVDDKLALTGPNSIIGRSCVVHMYPDDLGKGGHDDSLVNGHAGPRIGCGIVGWAEAPTLME